MGRSEIKTELREFGKIDFDFLLMTHIENINKQLAKLPHESIMANYNEPVGTTYNDIIQSYTNMVNHLEQLLKPYWDEQYNVEEAKDFSTSKIKFGALMQLCDRKGFLFTKIRTKARADAYE